MKIIDNKQTDFVSFLIILMIYQHIEDGSKLIQHALRRPAIVNHSKEETEINVAAVYKTGLIDGLSLPAFTVGASMIGYGALVYSADMSIWIAVVSTFGIWGLPGQVAFIEYVLLGAPLASMLLATSLANMRFLPMSLALIPMFKGSKSGWRLRYLWVQVMSVNTWVGLIRRAPELTPDERAPYYAGFSTTCLTAGIGGTALGYVLADVLPFFVTVTLVFLNPVYFAFVFAGMQSRASLLALAAGAIVGPPVYVLSPEWSLPVAGLIAGTAAFYFDRYLRRLS